ncbi:MAG: hypothetical protein IKJ77_03955 [Firmicutes bacterium]|nr:hypothetical protein [Bacillota bacterium]
MERIFEFFDLLPWIFGGLLIALSILVAIRIFIKTEKGETVHIESVGVFHDLPDTVTGLGKMEEARDE